MRDEYCSKRFVSENRMTSANLECGKDRNGRNQKRKGTDQTGSKEGEQRKERGFDSSE